MEFSCIGISRHRLGSDGAGVTTLVGGHGCPLDCKYCLNPQCKYRDAKFSVSIEELYERISVDSLYFSATNGGVTFGGGEPLLQAEFIRAFIGYCREQGKSWKFSIESCLAVDNRLLSMLDGLMDEYIIDVKDMNGGIYRAYTQKSPELMHQNITYLAKFADRVTVKLPIIPGFNTAKDVLYSENELRELGYTNFYRFRYITDINKSEKSQQHT